MKRVDANVTEWKSDAGRSLLKLTREGDKPTKQALTIPVAEISRAEAAELGNALIEAIAEMKEGEPNGG